MTNSIYNQKSINCLEGDSDGDTVEITTLLIDWIRVYLGKNGDSDGDLSITYEHQLPRDSKLSIPMGYIGMKSRISTINIQHTNYNQTFFLFESGLYTEGWSILLDANSNIISKYISGDDEIEEKLSTLNTRELAIFLLLKDKVGELRDLNFQSLLSLLPWSN